GARSRPGARRGPAGADPSRPSRARRLPRRDAPQRRGGTRLMDKFLNLVLSGLVTGAIYSIMASGLVLTYTTSGIFNFAHGAVAFATAYLYYQLNTGLGVPIVPSVIICVFLFAPLLGLALDRILLRR